MMDVVLARHERDAKKLRWALESVLGTSNPRQVRGVRVLSPEEALGLVQRIRRQPLTPGWTGDERRQWLQAVDESTRWDEVVPPHRDLDLRRRPVAKGGGARLEIVDRDVEEAQRRDGLPKRPRPAWDPAEVRRIWAAIHVPRWAKIAYALSCVVALSIFLPWSMRPLPRQSDYATAAALAQRIAGLVGGVLFAPVSLLVLLVRTFTIIPRRPPIPRGAHGLG